MFHRSLCIFGRLVLVISGLADRRCSEGLTLLTKNRPYNFDLASVFTSIFIFAFAIMQLNRTPCFQQPRPIGEIMVIVPSQECDPGKRYDCGSETTVSPNFQQAKALFAKAAPGIVICMMSWIRSVIIRQASKPQEANGGARSNLGWFIDIACGAGFSFRALGF